MPASPPARDRFDDEHLLWLKSLLLLMLTAFALIAAWHYGLLQQVLFDEPSGLGRGHRPGLRDRGSSRARRVSGSFRKPPMRSA